MHLINKFDIMGELRTIKKRQIVILNILMALMGTLCFWVVFYFNTFGFLSRLVSGFASLVMATVTYFQLKRLSEIKCT